MATLASAQFRPTWGIPTDGRIPALSFRIPWTYAIRHLNKRIENRFSWSSCSYRGPILLHASSWPNGKLIRNTSTAWRELQSDTVRMLAMAKLSGVALDDHDIEILPSLQQPLKHLDVLGMRGGVFGICELVNIIPGMTFFDGMVKSGEISKDQIHWYMGGFALVLDRVRDIPFVPCTGAPGLFGIAPSIYHSLNLIEESCQSP